jgi:antirestriction protein ArdC
MEACSRTQENNNVPNGNKEFASKSQRVIQETLERLSDQLERGMSDEMKRYLKAMAQFHRYSVSNQFLILSQCPHATRVAGFLTWRKFKRHVKKGEKGIKIIAPVWIKKDSKDEPRLFSQSQDQSSDQKDTVMLFRIQHVFDLSQTEGPSLPMPSSARGDAKMWLPVIEKHIRSQNILLDYKPFGAALGVSTHNEILIRPGMSSAETFSTLIHELTHVLLHHGPNRATMSREEQELEADSVACVVCSRFGIDAIEASSDYILNWKGDKQALLSRLERIRQCAAGIITEMEKLMGKSVVFPV